MTKQVISTVVFPEQHGLNIAQVESEGARPENGYISLHQNGIPALIKAAKAILDGTLPEALVTVPHIDAGMLLLDCIPHVIVEDMSMSIYADVFDFSWFDEEDNETYNRRLSLGFTDDKVFFGDNSVKCLESFQECADESQDSSTAMAEGLIIDRELLPELISKLEDVIKELNL